MQKEAQETQDYVIEMLNIRKEFPGIVANDNITLQLKPGEIHALLGENGAGKSTLMSILFGIYHPTSGSIKVRGKEVVISDPNVATELGIGMVHQHFKLVHNFTVAQNIILGSEGNFVIKLKEAEDRIRKLSEEYGLQIDPKAKIEDISVGMQQRVEILKMLYRDADILIFDEPTAVLTPQEIHELMEIMRTLVTRGKSILVITHKLKEIKAVADRCTIIRRGKYIDTVQVAEVSEADMAAKMVGRNVSFKVDKDPAKPGKLILDIKKLNVVDSRGVSKVKDVSLQVRAGEILGLAGVDGNGQQELIYALSGLIKANSGEINLNGKNICELSIRERAEAGLGHIPEDRHKHGLILEYHLGYNMVLKSYEHNEYSSHGFLKQGAIMEHGSQLLKEFDVRSGQGVISKAGTLSGGNQQKAIIAREIDADPSLLIAVQPTRGLDVGAIEFIHKRLIEQRDNGRAVLLVSLELDEILNLSDRIAVICNGEIVETIDAEQADEESVGLMMTGISSQPNTSPSNKENLA